MDNNALRFKRLSVTAIAPTRAHDDDVGFDLYADLANGTPVDIAPRDRLTIKTGIAVQVPDDCYGRVASRSGLSTKHKIDVGAGVIDKNYRGNVAVCLINSDDKPFRVHHGMKIAQLICERVRYPVLIEVSELDSTSRGCNGFGSTGH